MFSWQEHSPRTHPALLFRVWLFMPALTLHASLLKLTPQEKMFFCLSSKPHFSGHNRVLTFVALTFEDKILKNKKAGLHTLCLLDIKVKEQTVTWPWISQRYWPSNPSGKWKEHGPIWHPKNVCSFFSHSLGFFVHHFGLRAWPLPVQVENLMRGRKIYEPPRFMTATKIKLESGGCHGGSRPRR